MIRTALAFFCFCLLGCASSRTACDLLEVDVWMIPAEGTPWSLIVDDDGRVRLEISSHHGPDSGVRSWRVPGAELDALRSAIARERFHELPGYVGESEGYCSPIYSLRVRECVNSNSVWLGVLNPDEESRRVATIWNQLRSWVDEQDLEGYELARTIHQRQKRGSRLRQ